MSIVFKDLDEIPAFTGEEDVKEQIQKLYNYIYALKEQIRYLLQNLGVENMNSKAWKSMQEDTLAGQTQEDVFNKLFDNGNVQGFEIVDGKLYINAEFVRILNLIAEKVKTESKDGKWVVIDGNDISISRDDGRGNVVTIRGERKIYAYSEIDGSPMYADCGEVSLLYWPDNSHPDRAYNMRFNGREIVAHIGNDSHGIPYHEAKLYFNDDTGVWTLDIEDLVLGGERVRAEYMDAIGKRVLVAD